jgi:hypothetical protein
MLNTKYIGMDIHTETISIAVRNAAGKIVMECVIETKANTVLQFIHCLRGDLHVTFEEGTWAAWLYDLLKPHVTEVLVCDEWQKKGDLLNSAKLATEGTTTLATTTGKRIKSEMSSERAQARRIRDESLVASGSSRLAFACQGSTRCIKTRSPYRSRLGLSLADLASRLEVDFSEIAHRFGPLLLEAVG